jgi:hypothetical protein
MNELLQPVSMRSINSHYLISLKYQDLMKNVLQIQLKYNLLNIIIVVKSM